MPSLGISFSILPVIRSLRGGFLGLRSSCTMYWTSSGVRSLIGCIICSSSSSALLISLTKASFCGSSCGLNAVSKCPAKVFAFSLLPRAYVWSTFLIGGMRCVGCFNFWLLSRANSRCCALVWLMCSCVLFAEMFCCFSSVSDRLSLCFLPFSGVWKGFLCLVFVYL
jgi:hypothetical protein